MDYYQTLTHIVSQQCPPGFIEARINAELDDDWARIRLVCVTNDEGEVEAPVRGIELADIHENLDGVREEMASLSGSRWKSCTFTVLAGGKFRIDVQY
jgi:hypothetical protein